MRIVPRYVPAGPGTNFVGPVPVPVPVLVPVEPVDDVEEDVVVVGVDGVVEDVVEEDEPVGSPVSTVSSEVCWSGTPVSRLSDLSVP